MTRVLITMIFATGSAAVGQILLKLGMQQVGSLENYNPAHLVSYFWQTLCNPYVIFGTFLNAIFYFLFLATLSWTSVTIALPITAIEYGFAAFLAITILNEIVSPLRWIGIALVSVGVILIGLSGK